MFRKKNKSIIMSYLALRQLIGILGMLLPLICILGGLAFADLPGQRSISFYYNTNMRDFFVGLLIAVSMFLFTYKGYEFIDNLITSIIGAAGLGIAFFPVSSVDNLSVPIGLFQINSKISDVVHLISAAIFFSLLAANSMFVFTLSKDKNIEKTRNKKIRNIIYIFCGVIILLSLLMFPLLGNDRLSKGRMVLILETVMLAAFGLSWIVKGGTIFKDVKTIIGDTTISIDSN